MWVLWTLAYIALIVILCGLAVFGLILVLTVILPKRHKNYWPNKGVHHVSRDVTGHPINNILKPQTIISLDVKVLDYCKRVNAKYVGGHEFSNPYFFCRDLDVIKQILVKDFDYFVNRRKLPFSETDPNFNKMMFFMEGHSWKHLRTKLSPTFTTGKIKNMFKIFETSSKKFVQYLSDEISESESGDFDLTVGYGKYTMDVIASAAFGIDSNTFGKSDSVFEQMGQKMQLKISFTVILKVLFIMAFPNVMKRMGYSIGDQEALKFFSGVVQSVMNQRKSTGERRNDFIQLMIEARDGELGKVDETELDTFEKEAILNLKEETSKFVLDDEVIVAQSVLFISAGFDTTRSLLLFAAYQLALCPELQEKLYKEVESTWEEGNEEFTYDSINHMEYLDKFLCETLRMYPPAARTDRRCGQPFKVPGSDITLDKDTLVFIPVYAIHHDEEHYPDPEKFDPERFSPENKAKRNAYAYLPFGAGPRNCIGMRFALTEVKVVFAHFVRNFVVAPCEKTLIPMKFDNDATTKPTGGMWLNLKKRN